MNAENFISGAEFALNAFEQGSEVVRFMRELNVDVILGLIEERGWDDNKTRVDKIMEWYPEVEGSHILTAVRDFANDMVSEWGQDTDNDSGIDTIVTPDGETITDMEVALAEYLIENRSRVIDSSLAMSMAMLQQWDLVKFVDVLYSKAKAEEKPYDTDQKEKDRVRLALETLMREELPDDLTEEEKRVIEGMKEATMKVLSSYYYDGSGEPEKTEDGREKTNIVDLVSAITRLLYFQTEKKDGEAPDLQELRGADGNYEGDHVVIARFVTQVLIKYDEMYIRKNDKYRDKTGKEKEKLFAKDIDILHGALEKGDVIFRDMPVLYALSRYLHIKDAVTSKMHVKRFSDPKKVTDYDYELAVLAAEGEQGNIYIEGIDPPMEGNMTVQPDVIAAKAFDLTKLIEGDNKKEGEENDIKGEKEYYTSKKFDLGDDGELTLSTKLEGGDNLWTQDFIQAALRGDYREVERLHKKMKKGRDVIFEVSGSNIAGIPARGSIGMSIKKIKAISDKLKDTPKTRELKGFLSKVDDKCYYDAFLNVLDLRNATPEKLSDFVDKMQEGQAKLMSPYLIADYIYSELPADLSDEEKARKEKETIEEVVNYVARNMASSLRFMKLHESLGVDAKVLLGSARAIDQAKFFTISFFDITIDHFARLATWADEVIPRKSAEWVGKFDRYMTRNLDISSEARRLVEGLEVAGVSVERLLLMDMPEAMSEVARNSSRWARSTNILEGTHALPQIELGSHAQHFERLRAGEWMLREGATISEINKVLDAEKELIAKKPLEEVDKVLKSFGVNLDKLSDYDLSSDRGWKAFMRDIKRTKEYAEWADDMIRESSHINSRFQAEKEVEQVLRFFLNERVYCTQLSELIDTEKKILEKMAKGTALDTKLIGSYRLLLTDSKTGKGLAQLETKAKLLAPGSPTLGPYFIRSRFARVSSGLRTAGWLAMGTSLAGKSIELAQAKNVDFGTAVGEILNELFDYVPLLGPLKMWLVDGEMGGHLNMETGEFEWREDTPKDEYDELRRREEYWGKIFFLIDMVFASRYIIPRAKVEIPYRWHNPRFKVRGKGLIKGGLNLAAKPFFGWPLHVGWDILLKSYYNFVIDNTVRLVGRASNPWKRSDWRERGYERQYQHYLDTHREWERRPADHRGPEPQPPREPSKLHGTNNTVVQYTESKAIRDARGERVSQIEREFRARVGREVVVERGSVLPDPNVTGNNIEELVIKDNGVTVREHARESIVDRVIQQKYYKTNANVTELPTAERGKVRSILTETKNTVVNGGKDIGIRKTTVTIKAVEVESSLVLGSGTPHKSMEYELEVKVQEFTYTDDGSINPEPKEFVERSEKGLKSDPYQTELRAQRAGADSTNSGKYVEEIRVTENPAGSEGDVKQVYKKYALIDSAGNPVVRAQKLAEDLGSRIDTGRGKTSITELGRQTESVARGGGGGTESLHSGWELDGRYAPEALFEGEGQLYRIRMKKGLGSSMRLNGAFLLDRGYYGNVGGPRYVIQYPDKTIGVTDSLLLSEGVTFEPIERPTRLSKTREVIGDAVSAVESFARKSERIDAFLDKAAEKVEGGKKLYRKFKGSKFLEGAKRLMIEGLDAAARDGKAAGKFAWEEGKELPGKGWRNITDGWWLESPEGPEWKQKLSIGRLKTAHKITGGIGIALTLLGMIEMVDRVQKSHGSDQADDEVSELALDIFYGFTTGTVAAVGITALVGSGGAFPVLASFAGAFIISMSMYDTINRQLVKPGVFADEEKDGAKFWRALLPVGGDRAADGKPLRGRDADIWRLIGKTDVDFFGDSEFLEVERPIPKDQMDIQINWRLNDVLERLEKRIAEYPVSQWSSNPEAVMLIRRKSILERMKVPDKKDKEKYDDWMVDRYADIVRREQEAEVLGMILKNRIRQRWSFRYYRMKWETGSKQTLVNEEGEEVAERWAKSSLSDVKVPVGPDEYDTIDMYRVTMPVNEYWLGANPVLERIVADLNAKISYAEGQAKRADVEKYKRILEAIQGQQGALRVQHAQDEMELGSGITPEEFAGIEHVFFNYGSGEPFRQDSPEAKDKARKEGYRYFERKDAYLFLVNDIFGEGSRLGYHDEASLHLLDAYIEARNDSIAMRESMEYYYEVKPNWRELGYERAFGGENPLVRLPFTGLLGQMSEHAEGEQYDEVEEYLNEFFGLEPKPAPQPEPAPVPPGPTPPEPEPPSPPVPPRPRPTPTPPKPEPKDDDPIIPT